MINFDFTFKSNDVTNVWRVMFNSIEEAESFFNMDTTIPASHVASYVYKKDTLYGTEYLYEALCNVLLGYTCIDTKVKENFETLNFETLITFIGNVTYWDRYKLKEQYFDTIVTLKIGNFNYAGLSEDAYMQLSDTALYTADEERCFLIEISNSIYKYARVFEDEVVNPLERFKDNYIESVPGYKTVSDTYEETSALLENLISISEVFEKYADSYDELCKVI